MIQIQDRPRYHLDDVQPLREELTFVGFTELLTPDDVDRAITESLDHTTLFVINSVCGCAAGTARPGVTLALQHTVIPDRLYTAFAGMEKAAVQRLRDHLEPNLPSSPSMALFKQGKLNHILHRHDIEGSSARQVADKLIALFNRECNAKGPSIPLDKFAQIVSPQVCGSTLETFN